MTLTDENVATLGGGTELASVAPEHPLTHVFLDFLGEVRDEGPTDAAELDQAIDDIERGLWYLRSAAKDPTGVQPHIVYLSMLAVASAAATGGVLIEDGLGNEEGLDAFDAYVLDLQRLHARKSQDYGINADPFANVRASELWGVRPWVGAMVRLNDKVTRLRSFQAKGRLVNESVHDSLADIVVYAGIAYALYMEERLDEEEEF